MVTCASFSASANVDGETGGQIVDQYQRSVALRVSSVRAGY
jgi:hypothetical protein